MQRLTTLSEAMALKAPRELAIGIAKDPQGKYNPIALGWMMGTSFEPPLLAVSIGLERYSLEAFRQAGQFVVALPAADQQREAMLYGSVSGRDFDKLRRAGAKIQPADKIDCVLLAEAVANFECRLVDELATGDHVIFVGEVVCSYMHKTKRDRLYILGPGHTLGGLANLGAQKD